LTCKKPCSVLYFLTKLLTTVFITLRAEDKSTVIEIRFHGRGGQGAAMASSIIADAIFSEGRNVQSFPMFGVERRGAPVAAFIRVDDKPIRVRCEIEEPEYVLVLDPTLVEAVDVTSGVKPSGMIIVNSPLAPAGLKLGEGFRVYTFDGTSLSVELGLGTRTAPIVNTTMLGAFAKTTGLVGIDALEASINKYFPRDKDGKNAGAARAAYEAAPAA
jgi:2-oxoacid:acceptor oxidoreductase gamma subunit (pyruvate/2-ketoisovalerate family)